MVIRFLLVVRNRCSLFSVFMWLVVVFVVKVI